MIPIDANTRCDFGGFGNFRVTGADGRPYCRLPIFRETLPNGRSYDTIDLGRSVGDDYPQITVPAGQVFLMGDNRDDSADSRFPIAARGLGGPVPWENLGGRAEFITFSLDGNSSYWNPISWFAALRGGRAGTSLHAERGLGGPVPWENLGGRAEFISFSLDGSSSYWNPISWFTALRSGRAGTSLHAERATAPPPAPAAPAR